MRLRLRATCIISLFVALLCATATFAQTSKSTLGTQVQQAFPDNTSGLITPAQLRAWLINSAIPSWQQYLGVNSQVGTNYTIQNSDYGQLITFNNASTVSVSLPAGTAAQGYYPFSFYAANFGSGSVVITPQSGTINGMSNLVLTNKQNTLIVSDGTNWQTITFSGGGGGGGGGGSGSAGAYQVFSSPGTVSSVTLTTTPLPTSTSLIIVAVDGIAQAPTGWSINYTTGVITFSPSVTYSTNITVYWSISAASASALVPWTPLALYNPDCTGANDSSTALATAFAAASVVAVAPNCTLKLTSNVTIANGATLVIPCGSSISPSTGITLTIKGTINVLNGTCQVFGVSGNLPLGTVTGLRNTRPEWWGAQNNDTHDDAAALNAADASMLNGSQINSDGQPLMQLSCGSGYLVNSTFIIHPTVLNGNNEHIIGAGGGGPGNGCSWIRAGVSLTGPVMEVAGQAAGSPYFGEVNFEISTLWISGYGSDYAGGPCLQIGSSGTAIQGNDSVKSLVQNVVMDNCRISMAIHNARTVTYLNNSYVSPSGDASAIGILISGLTTNDFEGDSDVLGGQVICSGNGSGPAGIGVELNSNQSGTGGGVAGWRFDRIVFYRCATNVNSLASNGGENADVWFKSGVQFDGPVAVIWNASASNGSTNAISDYHFDHIYLTAGNGAGALYNIIGDVDNSINDITITSNRIRGVAAANAGRFIYAQNVHDMVVADNVLNGLEPQTFPTIELILLQNVQHAAITGNVCNPDGISGPVSYFLTSSSGADYVSYSGNMMGGCVTATLNGSFTHSAQAANYP